MCVHSVSICQLLSINLTTASWFSGGSGGRRRLPCDSLRSHPNFNQPMTCKQRRDLWRPWRESCWFSVSMSAVNFSLSTLDKCHNRNAVSVHTNTTSMLSFTDTHTRRIKCCLDIWAGLYHIHLAEEGASLCLCCVFVLCVCVVCSCSGFAAPAKLPRSYVI